MAIKYIYFFNEFIKKIIEIACLKKCWKTKLCLSWGTARGPYFPYIVSPHFSPSSHLWDWGLYHITERNNLLQTRGTAPLVNYPFAPAAVLVISYRQGCDKLQCEQSVQCQCNVYWGVKLQCSAVHVVLQSVHSLGLQNTVRLAYTQYCIWRGFMYSYQSCPTLSSQIWAFEILLKWNIQNKILSPRISGVTKNKKYSKKLR